MSSLVFQVFTVNIKSKEGKVAHGQRNHFITRWGNQKRDKQRRKLGSWSQRSGHHCLPKRGAKIFKKTEKRRRYANSNGLTFLE